MGAAQLAAHEEGALDEHRGHLLRDVRETRRLLWLAIRMTWQASPPLVLGIVLLLALQAALPPLQLALSKAVIDRVALDFHLGGRPASLAASLPLGEWIALAACAVAAGQLVQPFSQTFQSLAGDRLAGSLSERMIRAANGWQGLARFEDPGFADDLQRVRQGADRMGLQLLFGSASIVLHLVTMAALALTLVGLHPLAPLGVFLASIPQMALTWDYMNAIGSHLYFKTPEARRLEYSREAVLAPEVAKDVRLYHLVPFFERRYRDLFGRTVGGLDTLRRGLAVRVGLAGLLSAAAAAGVYVATVALIAQGRLPAGDLVLFGGAATLLRGRLAELAVAASYWPMAFGLYLPALDRVLNAPPDLPRAAAPHPAPRRPREGIVFDDVHFSYPGTSTPVLRGVSFAIRPGEGLALVGHNGAGNTTLVKLLLRFYDPTAGRVLFDGVDVREYDVEDLRRQMGVVFQDFVRYELTAGENIAMGDVEALGDRERLLAAAARGGASPLIAGLPHGLDTRVGRELGGRDLSGGEWQKLALARAFVRDCQVLILDEPTAALDAQTEFDVYSRFSDLTRGRMTLLISHRFSTVRMADRIAYLEDGRIQEEGCHADLMGRDGEYARLYRLQASQYLGDGEGGLQP